MDILLIGSTSSFMHFMVDKLNKEGHRIFHLTKEKILLMVIERCSRHTDLIMTMNVSARYFRA